MRTWLTIIYVAAMLAIAAMLLRQPAYNWDMLPYMALAIEQGESNIDSVHAWTYAIAREQLPPSDYELLVDSSNIYRLRTSREPATFGLELKYYAIKPLFILSVAAAWKLGAPLTLATVLPSIAALLIIGLLLLVWIRRIIPDPFATIVSFCIILTPFMLQSARASTPDLLTASLLLIGVFLILEKRSLLGLLPMLAAVAVRVDAALFVLLALLYLHYIRLLSTRWLLAALAGIVLMAIPILMSYDGSVGQLLIVRSAAERIAGPGDVSFAGAYLKGVRSGLGSLFFSDLFVALGVACTTFFMRRRSMADVRRDAPGAMLVMILLHIALRFILHPVIEDRFLVANYVIIAICGLMAVRDVVASRERAAVETI